MTVSAKTEEQFELAVYNKGISPAAMTLLFPTFSRGELRLRQQGLGLGLYIVSEIAKAHGSTIDVKSTQELTCFTLRMPLRPLSDRICGAAVHDGPRIPQILRVWRTRSTKISLWNVVVLATASLRRSYNIEQA